MRNAKRIFFPTILAIILFVSCSGQKKSGSTSNANTEIEPANSTPSTATGTTTESLETQNDMSNAVKATITNEFENEGCAWLILTTENGADVKFNPIALDDAFKVDGLKVKLEYRRSRSSQGKCMMADPIIIEKIEKL